MRWDALYQDLGVATLLLSHFLEDTVKLDFPPPSCLEVGEAVLDSASTLKWALKLP